MDKGNLYISYNGAKYAALRYKLETGIDGQIRIDRGAVTYPDGTKELGWYAMVNPYDGSTPVRL